MGVGSLRNVSQKKKFSALCPCLCWSGNRSWGRDVGVGLEAGCEWESGIRCAVDVVGLEGFGALLCAFLLQLRHGTALGPSRCAFCLQLFPPFLLRRIVEFVAVLLQVRLRRASKRRGAWHLKSLEGLWALHTVQPRIFIFFLWPYLAATWAQVYTL